ncbi:hypothetical protein ACI797_10015 [Geodermatophilus sp. SYSU D00691]
MTVIALPTHGRWTWDARGDGRAVRVSTHPDVGLLNVSIWRADVCVGTVRLTAADAAGLASSLTDGIARLVTRPEPAAEPDRLHELEARIIRLERRRPAPLWRRVPAAVAAWAGRTPGPRR